MTATVLVPSLQPGFLSRAGIVKEKATRLFVLTSAIAWCAITAALTIARDGLPDNREEYAKMIMAKIEAIAGPTTNFGNALSAARKEYDDCHQAYSEGQVKRRDDLILQMPKGVLPKKSVRAKQKIEILHLQKTLQRRFWWMGSNHHQENGHRLLHDDLE
jgi:hypothetical protein